jgi:glutamine synthetase
MTYDCTTSENVLRAIKDHKIQMIDLRYTDLPGQWQHFSVPPSALDLESFEGGVRFDGSSVHWFREIQEGDVHVIPDPASAFLDPFTEIPTLVLICNNRDLVTGQSYTRDPRYIAQKAEAYLLKTQIGNAANFAIELEHFVSNGARNAQSTSYDDHEVSTAEASCSAARYGTPGQDHIPCSNDRYFPVPPVDVLQEVRTQLVATIEKIGIKVGARHDGFVTIGQDETDVCSSTLTRMADNVMIYRYVVENVTCRRGLRLASIPKPLSDNNDGAMHVYQSIWLGERPLFAGDGYAGSSALMRHYMAGLLEHTPALLAICAATANSYHHLVPGLEAPGNREYSLRDRSAVCRIPMGSPNPNAKRVEFCSPDLSCNPYLAFAAMLMAGIDGFDNRLYNFDPDRPIEALFDLPPHELDQIPSAPGSLDPLEVDRAFLLKGDVFTPDVIETHLRELGPLNRAGGATISG